ncbi:MAG: tRNA uridine-5-carboxymethylaminomethyl(34) synthesis GTPase MnmE [Alphaproteobacteria bacterium]|nr:tRNA uridine-5-carboxymethylaminomethyl(34) synthesis GTPase MnmE [Alphaproteobacteria bacterium]
MHQDTIFALGSGQARAGIAVIRISGVRAGEALARLSGAALPEARRATRVRLSDPETGEALDNGLALWFPPPKSFTGEAVAELHLHGGRACVEGVLAALARLPGLRLADPGEFTRRAFENAKLDLTEVEGLADLIQAETAAQRRQALRQFEGALGERTEGWRETLLHALARMEAAIDFVDEELPQDVIARAGERVEKISAEIRAHLDDNRRGERLREGFRIVLLGAPNAGKSTLLNAIAQREAAIVSEEPGTTRDIVEVGLDLGGFPVVVADTAGLRESEGAVEQEGVRRARARARESDLRMTLFDGKIWPACDPETRALVDENTLPVITKADLHAKIEDPRIGDVAAISLSAKTGEGMDVLLKRLEKEITARMEGSETAPLTRLRHRRHLEECVEALERFPKATGPELAAEDLRLAVRALGRITGRVDVEEVLDRLFAEFCIGK